MQDAENRLFGHLSGQNVRITAPELFVPAGSLVTPSVTRNCESCGKRVDVKAAAYCRFNKARLGDKLFCRECLKTQT